MAMGGWGVQGTGTLLSQLQGNAEASLACGDAVSRRNTSNCRHFWKRTFPKYEPDAGVIGDLKMM